MNRLRKVSPLRVTHLSTHDVEGGAARAAWRLHRNLLDAGCESTMLVRHRRGDDPAVAELKPPTGLGRRIGRRLRRWTIRAAANRDRPRQPDWVEYFGDDRSDLTPELLAQLPPSDIINLHWVIGLLDYARGLPALAGRAPLIWRLPDLNALTGGCVYAHDCVRYRTHCGACPQLGALKERDRAFAAFERKLGAYARIDRGRLHFVALTNWMAGHVRNSRLGSRFAVTVIPNSINHEIFAPAERAAARAAFGLPADAPIVLFIAHDPMSRRKGLPELLAALDRIPGSRRPMLVTVGARAPEITQTAHRHLGMLHDDRKLALVYSAADLVAVPSLEENLPNTALEAIACGVPVVGFEIGGVPDIVRPEQTGLLAPAGDDAALSAAIDRILGDSELHARLSANCRSLATGEFDRATQASRYLALYQSMLQ